MAAVGSIARILALISFLVAVLFILGCPCLNIFETFGPYVSFEMRLQIVGSLILMTGLLLGCWKEGLGAVLILVGCLAFLASSKDPPSGPIVAYLMLCLFVAALYAWLWKQNRRRRIAGPAEPKTGGKE